MTTQSNATEPETGELGPCPRCGGGAEVFPEEQSISGGGYYVACSQPKFPIDECWLSLGEEYDRDAMPQHRFATKEDAIRAWNTRNLIGEDKQFGAGIMSNDIGPLP